MFELTDQIDTAIELVTHGEYPKNKRAEKAAQELIDDAAKNGARLVKFYKKVPCEEGLTTTTTTDTSPSTSTATEPTTSSSTTTTTPAQPACSDGADNDGDGKVDGGDSRCLSTRDTTEQTSAWPFHYPGNGSSGFDWIDLKPFFGPFAGTVMAYRVLFGMTTVHMSTSLNHGPTPINGTMPCPFLGPTGIRAGVGAMAPTGGGLPPAPDSDHLRIVIDTSDPAGGGDCGSGPADLEVATDTRLP